MHDLPVYIKINKKATLACLDDKNTRTEKLIAVLAGVLLCSITAVSIIFGSVITKLPSKFEPCDMLSQ